MLNAVQKIKSKMNKYCFIKYKLFGTPTWKWNGLTHTAILGKLSPFFLALNANLFICNIGLTKRVQFLLNSKLSLKDTAFTVVNVGYY